MWSGDDFRDRFSFIEHILPIDDERVNILESIVLNLLASDDHGGFDLVPPEDLGSEGMVDEAGAIEERYAAAVDVLAELHRQTLPAVLAVAPDVELYQITENGLALEATIQGTKYFKDSDLNAGR